MTKEKRCKAVPAVSQEEIFQSIGYAALKARAANLAPGAIVKIGSRELVVAEDEHGHGIVVQIIESKQHIEDLALAKAEEQGLDAKLADDHERREWMSSFLDELREYLGRWQDIKMQKGPGENLTFEKAVHRKSESWR